MSSTLPLGEDSVSRNRKSRELSYKFQRLRERLRAAVASGELSGKLPGERLLARKFHVNAKTLSKALTDLAAEGLLDRSIGRGTYVKGAAPLEEPTATRWLLVCDPDRATSAFAKAILAQNFNCTLVHDVTALRPSFLKPFNAVIDFATHTPEPFLRDLVVRNVPVVAVNREPEIYSVNTVGVDRALGASLLTRDLILAGHQRIAVVSSLRRSVVPQAVEETARRYAPQTQVTPCTLDNVVERVRGGDTAIVCDSSTAGIPLRSVLEQAGLAPGHDVSLGVIGCCDDSYPNSGYYVDCAFLAQAVIDLLKSPNGHRPAMLWLAPQKMDRGTLCAPPASLDGQAA